MKRLDYYLEKPFDDAAISVAELLAFTTDHLQRMIANNDSGQLTARITDTTIAFQEVSDCVSDDWTELGLRMARNQAKTDFRKDTLRAGVARIAGALKGAYADSAVVLVEALPKGRTIFTACRDDQVATYIAILHGVVTARAVDLPPAIVTLAGTLKTQWTAILAACEESTGQKISTENDKKLARQNLQLMLFLNLNKLAEMFDITVAKCSNTQLKNIANYYEKLIRAFQAEIARRPGLSVRQLERMVFSKPLAIRCRRGLSSNVAECQCS